ncbi:peptidoglycan-binding domain-containing protein [Streptomyces sp. BG2AG]|uniref:peptidoglycan-binding domain-containing protein n=1 Tax=unclassified Streptomyces TaxID=2593676 RepID=UPI0039F0B1C1
MTRLTSTTATAVRGAGVLALACAALFVTAAPAPAATNYTCTKPAYRKTSVNYGIYAGQSWEWKALVGTGQSGNSKARVKEIQCLLKYTHKVDPGATDGLWGPRTRAAVVKYQSSARLPADGIVGPQTWRSLRVGGYYVA